jgi:hypothetical protein
MSYLFLLRGGSEGTKIQIKLVGPSTGFFFQNRTASAPVQHFSEQHFTIQEPHKYYNFESNFYFPYIFT